MKAKKKRGVEVPQKIQTFVNSVTSLPLEGIEAPLANFSWDYDKGDFYHWVELMNHFDSFYEKHIRPRKDLHLEGEFGQSHAFPREAVLQILRVTRIILENCINKHCYSSYEHLSSLLASMDAEVVIGSLQTLAAFVKKPVQSNRAVRWHGDHTLNSQLFSLCQGWGVKEEGLGLVACAVENGCDLNVARLASTLHFEFYLDASSASDSDENELKLSGLKTIHIEDLPDDNRSDLDLFHDLVKQNKVPNPLRFSFLTRLRFAKSFCNIGTRRQYLSIRLVAFTVLVQSNPDSEDLTAFFNNEPEFISELVSLLHCEDTVPEDIRLLAVFALAAQAHDRQRQSSILSAISAGGNRGIFPTLVQNAVACLRGLNFSCSISFVEGLLYLVTVLVSSSAGCAALRECGLIPTLLPLLKDTIPLHTHLVASGVHILEAFMDYSNPAATLFRDLGGLDDAIYRLKFEIACVEENASRCRQEAVRLERGKLPVSHDGQQSPIPYPETVVSYHSRWLLKVLLRAISLGTYAPGNAGRISGSEENSLASGLCTIFRHAKEFGGGVFALAASLMSDLIHKDPTGFSTLDLVGLPKAFLNAITSRVLPSSEAVSCIPHTLDALCLNNKGLETVKECNALGCLVKIFTSKLYLRALSNETPSLLASGLDELMRHAPALRVDGVEACIAILDTISVIGGAGDRIPAFSQEERDGGIPVPMESDASELPQQKSEGATAENSNADSYVLEYIQNAARLLEPLLQNGDTSRVFVDKGGVEAFLRLYSLPNLPVSFGGSTVAHSMSSAFRAFSPTHASALSRAVCAALRESLTLSVEALSKLDGAKLFELETLEKERLVHYLSSTELYLSLVAVLVRSTNTMMNELNNGQGNVLSDVGKVYQAVLWQVSLLDDEKAESKKEESGNAAAAITHCPGGREGAEDLFSAVQYVNPVSIRDAASSHWDTEPEIFPLLAAGDGFHRRTRREQGSVSDLFSQRLRRLSRHAPAQAPQMDMEATTSIGEGSQSLDILKRKSPELVNSEVVTRLVSSARGLFAALGKSMVVPSRRRDDAVAPGSIPRGIAASIAKLLHDSLTFQCHNSMPLEIPKCHYLRKLIEDVLLLLFDNRRHTCNMLLLNSFYAHDVFGCLLQSFQDVNLFLWSVLQAPDMPLDGDSECQSRFANKKACVLETLQTFLKLLEHLVTPSLLLSSQSQILVQQVADAAIALPRDPETLVQRLQSRVLEVVLPVWNHPLFAKCGVNFISGVTSILTHIYSGVNDSNDHRNAGNRMLGPPPDEASISMIVEMGFSRERAEEALRRVVTNSVEMAMEWLFSHPEEQEEDELARALALSLGSSEAPADTEGEASVAADMTEEVNSVQAPPVEDIMCTCLTLVQNTDSVVFSLTDLLVTICNRNKGQDRVRIVSYLISQLNSCSKDDLDSDTSLLSVVSHFLAVILSEDAVAREIAAEQGLVSIVLDILSGFNPQIVLETSVAAPKWTTALLLVLDLFLQYKQKASNDQEEAAVAVAANHSLSNEKSKVNCTDSADSLTTSLKKYTGFMSLNEQHHAMTIACNFLNSHIPATSVQAVLQLCARLTKANSVAMQFLESGGLTAILSLPRRSLFPGFDNVAAVIIRHLLEDPHTLQQAMEVEIRHTLTTTPQRHGHTTPRMFLTALAPVVLRNPAIFMVASASVCKIENVNGQTQIILNKEREKDKDKDKDDKEREREKSKLDGTSKAQDSASKPNKNHHRKVPQSFAQVIEQLLEVVLHSPGPVLSKVTEHEDKGKRKCDEYDMVDQGSLSERSAGLAKVAFILKLMTEILLMYSGAAGVVLRRDSECVQGRVGSQESSVHGGLLHHILHNLLPSTAERVMEKYSDDEWREKLSVKAAYFLLAICIRSAEGRKRVIFEISRALTSAANNMVKEGKFMYQPPSRKAKAFVFLINIILSAHTSNHAQAPGFSADMAKTMIDAGLGQALTNTLRVVDLDHPEAVKFVNAVLRALEALTRAAATSDRLHVTAGMTENMGVVEERGIAQGVETEGQPHNGNLQSGAVSTQHNPDLTEMQLTDQGAAEAHTASVDIMESDRPVYVDRVSSETETGVLIRETDEVNVLERSETQAAEVPFHIEHRAETAQDDDDDEMDADEGEEDEEDEDEDELEGAEDVTHLSPPDTDVDEQDDHGLGDDYGDDMVEEEEDDWQEDQVIEMRWRDGLAPINNVPVLGPDGSASFVELPRDPFQSMNDIFSSFRRTNGVDRRRPAGGYRPHSQRPGGDHGGAFQHPLLTRLPASMSNGGALSGNAGWTLSGSFTSSADALLGLGAYDVSPFYMQNHANTASAGARAFGARLFGEHSVGVPLPPLLDFSMEAGYLLGRRGARSESRLSTWTDDGQPQAGAHAAVIAQCIEGHYTSYMQSLLPEELDLVDAGQTSEAMEGLEFDTVETMAQASPQRAALDGDSINLQMEAQAGSLQDIPMPFPENQSVASNLESQDERTAVVSREGGVENTNAAAAELCAHLGIAIDCGNGGEPIYYDGRGELSDLERRLTVEITQTNMDVDGYREMETIVDVSRDMETTDRGVQEGPDISGRQSEEGEAPAFPSSPQRDTVHGITDEGAQLSEDASRNGGGQDVNTIDPTFLEALPDYLRAEVLATHETQSMGAAAVHPPALPTEDIDPEFLAALPPDIQAEVLLQQRNQRSTQAQQAEGQPVEMDSASIIATFPAELREEVLLTSTDQVLAALPPSLLAEAQLLRERAMNQYQGSGLFGGGSRFGNRRHDSLSGLDRAIGNAASLSVVRRGADIGVKLRQIEGKPLVNLDGLKCLLQLLHVAQPLGKGLLQRILLNLCTNGLSRVRLVKLLLDLLRPGAHSISSDCKIPRLYGCRSNVVYARSQVSDGVPPLVSRRALEILTHLSKHLGRDFIIFTYLPQSTQSLGDEGKDKGKAKLIDDLSGSSEGDIPLVLLLKLLNQPLYSRSSAHLEQLMVLLEVVTNQLTECQILDQAKGGEIGDKSLVHDPSSLDVRETSRQDTNVDENQTSMEETGEPSGQDKGGDDRQFTNSEASTSGTECVLRISETLSILPEAELRKLCNLLAQPGLSDSAYSRVAEVLKKLATIAPAHGWLFKEELKNSGRLLCAPAIRELEILSCTEAKVLSTSSLAGGAILRVLQCLSSLTEGLGQQISSAVWDLNMDLEPLWQGLSSCVAKIESCLGNTIATSSAVTITTGSSSSPLPPETQRVLPFVEAFFVLSEKLRASSLQSQHLEPGIATAREIKEATGSASSTQKKVEGDVSFIKFAEKHRRMLNAFVRQNPSLLEKSFSVLLKTPRLIEFDNKRAFFRSRIKQQQDQHHHHPLRICVRRPYVLEDSYNQLRMRTVEELKGRLTVQFQGEEGIDAGGLTREWYQILSRVIFDKGALLFTTVGNDSTFQPNPNSVFQTEHLSYFKFVGRVVAKAVFDGQLLDVYFTRSFYKHILGVKVTYHDIEAVDPDYYKNLKWMLENDISDVVGVFFSVDADEEKHILYEKTEVTDVELVPGGRNLRVTEENKHEYVDLNAEHKLTTAIRPQINAFLEGFNELVNRELISIFNDKELELLISGLPEIDLEDLRANTEYTGYTAASPVVQWFWEVVQEFSKEDMARLLQFITGTSKVPLEGFRALQGISGAQRCQIHKAYGAPERLPTAHTCFNQLDLPEYSTKQQLQERLLLAIHEASEGFGFG
ncbi:hypothetical protein L7F22_031347 [Adiantum nelumboides]|nr:hypothetical protein [Adiantum nelumboides]